MPGKIFLVKQIRENKVSLWYDLGHASTWQAIRAARKPGEQGSGLVSVQRRNSVFSMTGMSFLDRAMAGGPGWEMQLPDESALLFPCLLPPRFPDELLPTFDSWQGTKTATSRLLGLADWQLSSPSQLLSLTSCLLLLGSVLEGWGKQPGCPGRSLFPQVEHELFCSSWKLWAVSQGLEKAMGCCWSMHGWQGMPVYVAEYGWPPGPILLGKQPFPHSRVPLPFPQLYATRKTSCNIFSCSVANIVCQNCQRNRSVRPLIKEFLCVTLHPSSMLSWRKVEVLSSLCYVE